jgi:hypothetical protein
MSFGEAASTITINGSATDFFKLFYKNSLEVALEWFVYPDTQNLYSQHCSDLKPSTLILRNSKS